MSRTAAPRRALAIVGAACRFPGPAYSLEAFRQLLLNGQDAVSTIPEDRFAQDRFFSAARNLPGHSYTNAAGILPDLLDFDPEFFGISRTEALDMDPQQRLVLEMTWEALEHAGIRPSSLRGSATGVYMGAAGTDTALRNTDDVVAGSPYTMTGGTLSIVSNRVSYLFDFHGPSLSIDTACSSSLVALHLACEALRAGQIPLAVVGAVNCLFAPYPFAGFSKARMLSPDGRCKVFDASGNGYVRSEGGGVVLVTTLEQAEKHGWEILSLIAGTGVNSDGRTTGIALPNQEAQAALIRDVYRRFKLNRDKLVYVEAHGTGTAAGDPLEASAIGAELGRPLAGKRVLHVGSVKSNIGHLETSAGMAGLIKALLVLRHGEIPPNLHFQTPNPAIDFAASNIQVPTTVTPLPQAGGQELVSVNSFGFGGTNAHVVLQKPETAKTRKKQASRIGTLPPLLLSARSGPSLRGLAEKLADQLDGADSGRCTEVAHALAFHRDHLPLREVVTGSSVTAVRDELIRLSKDEKAGDARMFGEHTGSARSGVFAFSGNGSQWSGMCRSLLRDNGVFRQSLEEIDAILNPLQGWSLLDVLRNPEEHAEAFSQTEKSQPLIFATQVGIVRHLESRGIRPGAVIGHSVGEVAAAWCAGALSLSDAALVIHVRSLLQTPLFGTGGMAAANMSEAVAREMLKPFGNAVEIAAINTQASLSLAGETEALRAVVEACGKRRIAAKLLSIPYPFHTHFMDAIKEELGDALSRIEPRKPVIPFFSTVYGRATRSFKPDAAYWRNNVRRPVLFAAALQDAHAKGFRLFMEIGASPVLRSYIRDTFRDADEAVCILPTMTKGGDEQAELEAVWKQAWRHGWKLDLERLFPDKADRVGLPLYSWNKERCWRASSPECRGYVDAKRVHPLLGWQLPGHAPVFENTIHPADFPWLEDHLAGSQVVFPAAAFLESMLAAGRCLFPERGITLERVALFRPLTFAPDSAKALRLSVDREDGGLSLEGRTFNSPEAWGTYARARLIPYSGEEEAVFQVQGTPEGFGVAVDKDSLYSMAKRAHLFYGPSFRTVREAWVKPDPKYPEALARLRMPEAAPFSGMHIPPTLLDGAFHTLFLLLGNRATRTGQAYLPAAFDRVSLLADGIPRFAHARLEKVSARSIVASFRLLDDEGHTLLLLHGCRFRRALWLEHENAPSRPYVPAFLATPHPLAVTMPRNVTPGMMKKAAQSALRYLEKQDSGDSPHSWLLLQLASLAAARESVLSLRSQADQHKSFSCEELLASGMLAPAQEPWFRHMLEGLEKASFAVREDNHWSVPPQDKRRSATMLWRTSVATEPEQASENALLAHVFATSRSLLKNEAREGDVCLPASLVTAYYGNAASLKPYVEAAQQAVRSALGKVGFCEELRVLQVARDPEAFISPLIPILKGVRCTYVAATEDENAAESGNERFSQTPGVRFTRLSLEDPGEEHHGRYHMIILGWVLRDAMSVSLALAQCRKMLAPGGVLVLLEQPPSAFSDYVFGSSPSWWRASPDRETPVSLLQYRKYWEQELQHSAFTDIESLGSDHDPAFLVFARRNDAVPLPEMEGEADESQPPGEQPVQWIVVGGTQGTASVNLAERLAASLQRTDQDVLCLWQGKQFGGIAFNAQNPDHWRVIAKEGKPGTRKHLLFLAGYDDRDEPDDATLSSLQLEGTVALTALAQAWDRFGGETRLWVFAGGAFGGFPDDRPVPSQGALLGFTRVLSNELRSQLIRFVDLHGTAEEFDPEAILREALYPDVEAEVILTPKSRYIPRLSEPSTGLSAGTASAGTDAETVGVTLTFDQPGRLRNLYWKETTPALPGPGEVRVHATHTGLNFRDVMWSMGLLPDEALENGFSGAGLGIECSGIIDAVGEGVTEWAVGDEVLCFAPACFSSHVITPASAVAAKPANVSFAEAATIPVAFITAWYSLHHLARLKPGDRVLIHGAAGGVGLAAIQIAAHLGLEVHATAGAAEKHHFLKRLGITRIYSSRSLDFADQILEATNGEGVDCVLNSLSGEAAAAGIGLLRPFGHFIELGKRDFYADAPMRLRPFSNNLTYYGVDVDQLIIHKPELAHDLFAELMGLFAQRKLIPLPHSVYASDRVVDAFKAMQQSTHIGKLVVSIENAERSAIAEAAPSRGWKAKGEATYLVSGGSGGLGLASARYLADRGARNLILLSRRGVIGEEEQSLVAALTASGVKVEDVQADVTDSAALRQALTPVLDAMPPLAGVIHAAALLDDGLIQTLTPQRLENALAAKSMGAWNLHQVTLGLPLDFFVLFSSATTSFGNPGQAGYVAANCMLETLAAWRQRRGLPASVIGWGPIGDTGMLTRNPKARQLLLQKLGISPTSSDEAMFWLGQCLTRQIAHSQYFGLNWQSRADLPILGASRFSLLRPYRSFTTSEEGSIVEAVRAAGPKDGVNLIAKALLEEIGHILRLPADKLAADAPLAAQGMDSLMAVELALAVEQKFELTGFNLPLTEKTTALALAKSIHALIMGAEPEGAGTDIVDQITQKHGVHLSEEVHEEMVKSLAAEGR